MLILINVVMIFFIFHTVKVLENNASIVNRMGVIRGSIQRITKLELSGNRNHYTNLIEETDQLIEETDQLIEETDQLIESLLEDKKLVFFAKDYTDFDIENIIIIQNKWHHLKKLLATYQANPTTLLLIQILNESEASWELTNFVTLNAQEVAESKVSGINNFYIILLIYTINVLLVIWVVYSYVRNNLEFKASYDSLTGLANRHSYEKTIEAEVEQLSLLAPLNRRHQENIMLQNTLLNCIRLNLEVDESNLISIIIYSRLSLIRTKTKFWVKKKPRYISVKT